MGEVMMRGVKQGKGFLGAELEESHPCLFAVQQALDRAFRKVIIKGDCLSLISKLHKAHVPANSLGFFYF